MNDAGGQVPSRTPSRSRADLRPRPFGSLQCVFALYTNECIQSIDYDKKLWLDGTLFDSRLGYG